MAPYFLGSSHRVEHASHDLLRARAIGGVGRFGLEQFRVRQDDAQLIVQLVKERAQLCVNVLSVRVDRVR